MQASGWSSSRAVRFEEILQQQGRFSAREAALLGVDVCEALAAVHAAGLLHRDVKAQNVMRDRNGRIVLMDFGTGRARDLPDDTPVADLAGTPLYMAPELFRGERASVQSDVYSMGVLLYRLVTGSFPVGGRSLAAVREGHAKAQIRHLRDQRSDLPAPFIHIVERALVAGARPPLRERRGARAGTDRAARHHHRGAGRAGACAPPPLATRQLSRS